MRGDIEPKQNFKARTKSEAITEARCCGYNVVAMAKYANLIVGTILIVIVI